MKRLKVFRTLAALAIGVGLAQFALAQPDAGAKMRGETKAWGSYSGQSMRSARGYTRDYRDYAHSAPTVNPDVAREASDAIGDYIRKAQKHMAYMRKQARDDKATLASLDVIDKNLADAGKAHHEMHDTCLKDNVSKTGSMKCCEHIDDSLSKAIAEHDKLMKRLGESTPAKKK